MSDLSCAPSGVAVYRLVVEAAADANVLLRLLEPFVIHDVLPHRIDVAHLDDVLAVELVFTAGPDLAIRLENRLRAMVSVSDVAMALASPALQHGKAPLTAAA
ncbi:hypothetical protein [Azorhizobium sp. AG788]|uniref:hypothetical protein n=1 Tax=Azorhizobium sp. AG788 TaxID=2183897 RepID=UPI0031392FFA